MSAARRAKRAGAAVARLPAGIRYMAAGAFFFSVMSLLVKLAGERIPFPEIVLVRSLIGLGLCWVGLRRARVAVAGKRKGLLMVRGVVGFCALSAFFYGLTHLPLAEATVIQYTNPVFTAVLAALFLGEAAGWREVGSLALSMAGVVVVARPDFLFGGAGAGLDSFAVAVALAGALLSAGAYVAVRKLGSSEHHLVIVFYFAAISVLGSAPFVAADPVLPTATEWLLLLGVGVTTQLGQVAITHGLREERAGRATTVAYLQILFAAAWGALFFAEVPDGWTWAGTALIVAGTVLVARAAATSRTDDAAGARDAA